MSKRALSVLLVIGTLSPGALAAQGVGLGARAGTLGLGGEVAIEVTPSLVVRGGLGIVPFEPSMTFSDVDVSLKLPTVYNVGVDLYLNGAVRVGGGILFRSGDPELKGEFNTSQDIGGTTFTPQELGTLTGVLDAKNRAPYVLLGFGRHTAEGTGLFLDLGIVVTGEPDVRLSASGGTLSDDPSTVDALRLEAADFEDDMRSYLKIWPILSLGIRFGAQ